MKNNSKIQSISNLATKLVSKEMNSGTGDSSAELLQALADVAKLLESQSGSNQGVKDLAIQVQDLVRKKVAK